MPTGPAGNPAHLARDPHATRARAANPSSHAGCFGPDDEPPCVRACNTDEIDDDDGTFGMELLDKDGATWRYFDGAFESSAEPYLGPFPGTYEGRIGAFLFNEDDVCWLDVRFRSCATHLDEIGP